MNDDIHGTFSADISDKPSWRDSPAFKSLEALRPWLQWALIAVMAGFVYYQSQRETNAQQAVSVSDISRKYDALAGKMDERTAARDKQIDDIKRQILTREVFEAYHKADAQRMDRIEKTLEMIAQRP